MTKHEFLSADWIEASRKVRSDYSVSHDDVPPWVANYTISNVPFLDGATAEFNLDMRSPLFYQSGHVDDPTFTVASDYETAKEIYHDRSWGWDSLQDAYADGRVQITGPVDELREFWADVIREPAHMEMYDKIVEFTA